MSMYIINWFLIFWSYKLVLKQYRIALIVLMIPIVIVVSITIICDILIYVYVILL